MTKVTQMTIDDGGIDRRRIHLREISGDSDAPLETVGQDLRTARLRRGDDLASVSRALKIRKDHIEALEEDNFDALPGKTYAVGFVRSYAAYLGLDEVQCVERFKAEIAGRSEEYRMAPAILDREETRKLPQGWRIIAGFVIITVAYGVYHLWSADRPAPTPVPAPPVALAPSAPTPAPAAALPQQQAAADAATNTAPDQDSQPPPGAAAATATQAVATPAAPKPAADSAPAVPDRAAPIGPGQVYGQQNREARVVLRARGATRILVRGADGRIFANRSLNPGDSYRVPNISGLTLATTNAGAVELDLDGTAMGRAGGDLQTTGGLSLDPQAIVDRYNNGPG